MNKLPILILLVAIAGFGIYLLYLQPTPIPATQLNTSSSLIAVKSSKQASILPTSTPSDSHNQSNSELQRMIGIFWDQNDKSIVGEFKIGSHQAINTPFYNLLPVTSTFKGDKPIRFEYQWKDLDIIFGEKTTLMTPRGVITINWNIGDAPPEVLLFEFQGQHYFLLKTSSCGNRYCNGEYRMYRLSEGGDLMPIANNQNGVFWSTGGQGGYSSGKFWGAIAIQDRLHLVFMKGGSGGASTIILNQGNFEQVIDAPNVPLYGDERIYINTIVASWGLQ